MRLHVAMVFEITPIATAEVQHHLIGVVPLLIGLVALSRPVAVSRWIARFKGALGASTEQSFYESRLGTWLVWLLVGVGFIAAGLYFLIAGAP